MITIEEIVKATNGELIQGNLSDTISDFQTDSRPVNEKSFYCLILGERVDGHTFIKDVEQKGADLPCSDDQSQQKRQHVGKAVPLPPVHDHAVLYEHSGNRQEHSKDQDRKGLGRPRRVSSRQHTKKRRRRRRCQQQINTIPEPAPVDGDRHRQNSPEQQAGHRVFKYSAQITTHFFT